MIVAQSSLVSEELPEQDPMREVLLDIERTCERATSLTRQLQTFARGGEPVRKLCEVPEVVRESVEFSSRGGKASCEFHLPDELWPSRLDVGQITQALTNLVLNAREAEAASIIVSASNLQVEAGAPLGLSPGPYVQIVVRDTGVGIQAEHLERVFDPYFTTKLAGTGLGLSSAYSIVRRHDGLLRVESKPGEGTSFFMYLPADPNVPVEVEGPVPDSVPWLTHSRVLVMDDEARLRELIADCLVALKCEVHCTADGREAVSAYRRALRRGEPFDTVILDLTVRGGMGGVEAVEELRKLDPEVRAVACSGYADDPVMAHPQQFGFAAALQKPFRFPVLARVVRECAPRSERVPAAAGRASRGPSTEAARLASPELSRRRG
jgi:CheY-like chemotaxis protein